MVNLPVLRLDVKNVVNYRFLVYLISIFFGYYDIQQLNAEQDKMLVTAIPEKADKKGLWLRFTIDFILRDRRRRCYCLNVSKER